MVALRGLGFAHIHPKNLSKHQSVPSSPVVSPSSIEGLLKRVEAINQAPSQTSSAEDFRREPAFRNFSPVCSELHSQSLSSIQIRDAWWTAQENLDRPCSPCSNIWEGLDKDLYQRFTIPHPYTIPHDLFDFAWGIEEPTAPLFDLNLRANSITLALDSTIDSLRTISPRVYSTGFAWPLENSCDGSHQSYSTSVRELIQDEPDFPIGGIEAAPMAATRSSNIGTVAIQSTDAPLIQVTPPELPECCEQDVKPKRYEVYSTSSDEIAGTENRPMVTAPETPLRTQRPDQSTDQDTNRGDEDHGYKKRQQKVKNPRNSNRSDDSNRSQTSEILGTQVRDFAMPMLASDIGPLSKSAKGVRISEPPNRQPLPNAPGVPLKSAIANIAKASDVVAVTAPAIGLPTDLSGRLPALPVAGPQVKTRKRIADKGRKFIRKGRAKVIRRPIMVMIVGKQLAGPTCFALKLIAEGKAVDPKAVLGVATDAASGVSPLGGPPIPA